jgi:hypothetical protein
VKLRFLLLIFVFCTAAVAREQQAIAVWDANCIRVGLDTRASAPLKDDGTPDLSHVVVHKVVLDMKCYRIEVQR